MAFDGELVGCRMGCFSVLGVLVSGVSGVYGGRIRRNTLMLPIKGFMRLSGYKQRSGVGVVLCLERRAKIFVHPITQWFHAVFGAFAVCSGVGFGVNGRKRGLHCFGGRRSQWFHAAFGVVLCNSDRLSV